MSGFQGCCPRLCVDKMAPWPSSAPSIMAGCCREGEIKRCCWGWGAAGSVFFFFFPELSCLFPSFLFLLAHRTDCSLAYSLVGYIEFRWGLGIYVRSGEGWGKEKRDQGSSLKKYWVRKAVPVRDRTRKESSLGAIILPELNETILIANFQLVLRLRKP